MHFTPGISIILCCFNSATRLPPTLQHLALQEIPANMPCELVIINNNSTDNTVISAKNLWQEFNKPFPLRIIEEATPGTGHARRTGLKNARYEYILFVDDDNYLLPGYIKTLVNILDTNKDVAACGGLAELPEQGISYDLPDWWDDFKHAYAVGPQGKSDGYADQITTAGMGLRKSVYTELAARNYQLILSGRQGNKNLAAGEDYELCAAFRCLGYKLFYTPDLKLIHNIDKARINKDYLCRMYRDNGPPTPYLSAYYFILKTGKHSWIKQLLVSCAFVSGFAGLIVFYALILNKRKAFKYKVKNQAALGRLRHLTEIGPKEFNAFCERVYHLKKGHKPYQ